MIINKISVRRILFIFLQIHLIPLHGLTVTVKPSDPTGAQRIFDLNKYIFRSPNTLKKFVILLMLEVLNLFFWTVGALLLIVLFRS